MAGADSVPRAICAVRRQYGGAYRIGSLLIFEGLSRTRPFN
jgi:hypothetical protein